MYKTLGHYHIARLNHLASHRLNNKYSIKCLVLADRQNSYFWNTNTKERMDFELAVLFPGELLENVRISRQLFKIASYIYQTKPAFIFTANYEIPAMFFASIISKVFNGIPVSMSDTTFQDRPRKKYKEFIKKLALLPHEFAFVAGSRSMSYIKSLGFSEDKIYTGCDVVDNSAIAESCAKFKSSALFSDKNIICIARLIHEKNMFRLLDAFKIHYTSCDLPYQLNVCGDGPLMKSLIQYKNDNNIQGVTFSGYIAPPAIFEQLASAEALILPSVSESWGLVVNEAMAAGLPVLVSKHCGCVPELVVEGVTGWTFNPSDPDDIALAMSKLYNSDTSEVEKMKRNCIDLIAKWDLSRFSDEVENLVFEVNTGPPR